MGWWRFAITWEPYYLTLLWIDFALGAFILLITCRIARRFGWQGLTAAVIAAAVCAQLLQVWEAEECAQLHQPERRQFA